MYEKLLDLDNLYAAFQKCKKNTYWKKSVQVFEFNLIHNLLSLKKELQSKTYKQKPFNEFWITDRGKKRHIKALTVRDRVVQHVLCDTMLFPSIERYLDYDNGACIKNKGISFTRRRLKAMLEKYNRKYGSVGYVLRIDIHDYFNSIQKDIVCKQFAKHIQDKDVLNLVTTLLAQYGDEAGVGSQLYQVIGAMYLTPLDRLCKVVHRIKVFSRYQDDTVMVHNSKRVLENVLQDYKNLCRELGLELNPKKTYIQRLDIGFEFLKEKWLVRNKVLRIPESEKFRRELRKISKTKNKVQYKAWAGTMQQANCKKKLHKLHKQVSKVLE